MRIYLHIGPHKTGTTSIQAYLGARIGSVEPSGPVWYPEPDRKGPGHAHLASLMNRRRTHAGSNPLHGIVREAELANVATLILSSEDFDGAYPERLPRYAEALTDQEVVLITTQTSLPNRIASLWQELVKHGHQDGMLESMGTILNRNEFRPDFLATFAQALHPREIVIVYSHPHDESHILIHRFMSAIGLPLDGNEDPDASTRRNVRLGWIEVETLRRFNQALADHAPHVTGNDYNALRNVLLRGFRSKAWRQQCPHFPIETPHDVVNLAVAKAVRLAAGIEDLKAHWPVRILGDPEALVAVSSTEAGVEERVVQVSDAKEPEGSSTGRDPVP